MEAVDKRRLIDHLRSRIKEPLECAVCKNAQHSVEGIFEMKEYCEAYPVMGAPMVPLVLLTCIKCGNTRFLNAVILGAVSPTDGKFCF